MERLLSEERLPSAGIPAAAWDCVPAALLVPTGLLYVSGDISDAARGCETGALLVPTALLYLSAAAEILAAALLRWLWALFTGCGCRGHFS